MQRTVIAGALVVLTACAGPGVDNRPISQLPVADLCRLWLDSPKGVSMYEVASELGSRSVPLRDCPQYAAAKPESNSNVLLKAAAVGLLTAAIVRSGGAGGGFAPANDYQWERDLINDPNGGIVWVCRGVQSGQFAEDARCFGKPYLDRQWPGLGQ